MDDVASIAAAFSAGKPTRFIKGIVKVPPATMFASAEPEISPVRAEDTTDALAGPPRKCPSSAIEDMMNQFPAPALSSSALYSTNRKTRLQETPRVRPNTPSPDSHM